MTLHEEIFDAFEVGLVAEAVHVISEELDGLPTSEWVGDVTRSSKVLAVEREGAGSHEEVL